MPGVGKGLTFQAREQEPLWEKRPCLQHWGIGDWWTVRWRHRSGTKKGLGRLGGHAGHEPPTMASLSKVKLQSEL